MSHYCECWAGTAMPDGRCGKCLKTIRIRTSVKTVTIPQETYERLVAFFEAYSILPYTESNTLRFSGWRCIMCGGTGREPGTVGHLETCGRASLKTVVENALKSTT